MKAFKKILFVTDQASSDKSAFERTINLAEQNRSALTVVAVVPKIQPDVREALEKVVPRSELEQMVVQQQNKDLGRFIEPFKDRRKIQTKVLVGRFFFEVMGEVLRGNYDLVVKVARLPKGPKAALFGSVDMHLIRKCSGPVWIIKPAPRRKLKRILAAVDPQPADNVQLALSVKVVEAAVLLSRLEDSELHVAHAWDFHSEEFLRGGYATVLNQEIKRIEAQQEVAHRERLGKFLAKFTKDGTIQVHLLRGDPQEVIPVLAEKKHVNLVVMGTVGRTGIPGFFIGNTAEEILNQVDCSVLTMKPDGFVSPVTL